MLSLLAAFGLVQLLGITDPSIGMLVLIWFLTPMVACVVIGVFIALACALYAIGITLAGVGLAAFTDRSKRKEAR